MVYKMTVALKQQNIPSVNILSLAAVCEKLPRFTKQLGINHLWKEKTDGWNSV